MNTKEYFYLSDEELMHLIDLSEADGLLPAPKPKLLLPTLSIHLRLLPCQLSTQPQQKEDLKLHIRVLS